MGKPFPLRTVFWQRICPHINMEVKKMKTRTLFLLAFFCLLTGLHPTPSPDRTYDTDLCITRYKVRLTPDLENNRADIIADVSIRNFSQNTIGRVDFLLGISGNHDDWNVEVTEVRFIENEESKKLSFSPQNIPNPYGQTGEWRIYDVDFHRALHPDDEIEIQFVYSINGKSKDSGFPLARAKEKELYLISDFAWLPTVFFKPEIGIFPNLYRPEWYLTVTYPSSWTAVVDGRRMKKSKNRDTATEEWKSVASGTPQILIGPYETIVKKEGEFIVEIYTPHDPEIIGKTEQLASDITRVFKIYSGLYGSPGSSTYRLIVSHTDWGGHGIYMGQVIQQSLIRFLSLKTLAHELAHTWWGLLCASFGEGSKFLREALAEFSAFWAIKEIDGDAAFRNNLLDAKAGFFTYYLALDSEPAQVPLIEQEGFDPRSIVSANYRKGPLVVNQLRLELGDALFFRCLKAFTSRFINQNVTMSDFIQTFNEVTGKDLTPLFKSLCRSPGYPSYRLLGFQSSKEGPGYVTTVKIQNEGSIGATCPLLLKMGRDENWAAFRLDGNSQGEFRFFTEKEVKEVFIDPEMTAFHYHPDDRIRLVLALDPSYLKVNPGINWLWFRYSYALYLDERPREAFATLSEYLRNAIQMHQVKDIDQLLAKDYMCLFASYLLTRSKYRLGFHDDEGAQADAKKVIDSVLRSMQKGKENFPQIFYLAGNIPEPKIEYIIDLIEGLTGKDFFWVLDSDTSSQKKKIEEWSQWWEKEGKNQNLNLDILRKKNR
jgi:hypothetical protein